MKLTATVAAESTSENQPQKKLSILALLREKLNKFDPVYRGPLLAIGISVLLLLFIMLIFLISYQQSTVSNFASSENKHSLMMLHELREIDNQLQTLSTNPQNSDIYKNALASLNADLANLQKSINEVAKSSDIQKVAGQIAAMKEDVDSQIGDLKRTVANSQDTKQYVDPKILPFHVISVDVIAQQPFVSINYANHITPFAVGDTIAGWQIASADYDAAQVEFKNDHDQYIKVSLQG